MTIRQRGKISNTGLIPRCGGCVVAHHHGELEQLLQVHAAFFEDAEKDGEELHEKVGVFAIAE